MTESVTAGRRAAPGEPPDADRLQDRLARLGRLGLTRFAHQVASARAGPITTWLIRDFIRRYSVNMGEAAQPDPTRYPSFNAFFTRALRAGVRPLAGSDWICPVDGAISQCGRIEGEQIFQAKGHRYTTQALVGGDATLAARFQDGAFATIYLSPRDYHRIHMPCAGRLLRMIHVPGDLYSVNPATALRVPGLFARNERVVCEFATPHGPMVLVLVGATIVGSMTTTWHGAVNPRHPTQVREWLYIDAAAGPQAAQDPRAGPSESLARGAEMGRFLLGSTVVLLWPRDTIDFEPAWQAAKPVRLGEAMAHRSLSAPPVAPA